MGVKGIRAKKEAVSIRLAAPPPMPSAPIFMVPSHQHELSLQAAHLIFSGIRIRGRSLATVPALIFGAVWLQGKRTVRRLAYALPDLHAGQGFQLCVQVATAAARVGCSDSAPKRQLLRCLSHSNTAKPPEHDTDQSRVWRAIAVTCTFSCLAEQGCKA